MRFLCLFTKETNSIDSVFRWFFFNIVVIFPINFKLCLYFLMAVPFFKHVFVHEFVSIFVFDDRNMALIFLNQQVELNFLFIEHLLIIANNPLKFTNFVLQHDDMQVKLTYLILPAVDDAVEEFLVEMLIFDLVGKFNQCLFISLNLLFQLVDILHMDNTVLFVGVDVDDLAIVAYIGE